VSVAPPGAPPAPGTVACPRCGASIGPDQSWCLECGAPARTRLVPTPNWRLPLALAAVVAALALLAIAVSFVQLTKDDAPVTPTVPTAAPAPAPTTTAAPAPTTTAAPAPTTTAPPAATATTPGAATTTPGDGATSATPTTTTP
jgi:hypothetical protein